MFLAKTEAKILIFLFFLIALSWGFLTVPNLSNPKLIYVMLFSLMGGLIAILYWSSRK